MPELQAMLKTERTAVQVEREVAQTRQAARPVESRTVTEKSIAFIVQFYYPDGWGGTEVLRDITVHFATSGFEVRVICGSEQYAPVVGEPGPDPAESGVSLVRLPRLMGGDIRSRRLVRQLWFCVAAVPALCSGDRPDLYVAQTDPPIVVPLVALVARLRRVPLMIIAQDLYPDIVFTHGMLRSDSHLASCLRGIFGWTYRSAAGVVTPARTIADRLVKQGVKRESVSIIPNWAAGTENAVRGDANILRHDWDLQDKFVVLYSGNLGVAHDIETPIRAVAEAVKRRPDIRLVFIGNGVRLSEAKTLVHENGLSEFVVFRSLVPTELLPHSMGLADVGLVTLREAFAGLVFPSKLLGYMARETPAIYVGPPSDVADILAESGGGVCFTNGDWMHLADQLVTMASNRDALVPMGKAAGGYYAEHFARSVALERYAKLIQQLSDRSPSKRQRR